MINSHKLLRSAFLAVIFARLLYFANVGALAQSDASYFADISGWYRSAIEYSLALGIFKGTSEDTFRPNQPMTQAKHIFPNIYFRAKHLVLYLSFRAIVHILFLSLGDLRDILRALPTDW